MPLTKTINESRKSPGLDGFQMEYYKHYIDILAVVQEYKRYIIKVNTI